MRKSFSLTSAFCLFACCRAAVILTRLSVAVGSKMRVSYGTSAFLLFAVMLCEANSEVVAFIRLRAIRAGTTRKL